MRFDGYEIGDFYDEMFDADDKPRSGAELLYQRIRMLSDGDLLRRQNAAERMLLHQGITFGVYNDDTAGIERIFPFDIVPRIVPHDEWENLEKGLQQRIRAMNFFIDDVYHDQKILRDGVVPRDIVESCEGYRRQCIGINPPLGVWCHITGTDLVRDGKGVVHVLEDNLRTPSGVSYVLENRHVMKNTFPQLFEQSQVVPVEDYPNRLRQLLESLAPPVLQEPRVVVLTPGVYNSAYFEHSYLAREMGVDLVQPQDLVVNDGNVTMRTTKGFERVDVIYRRIDDDFLDPQVFRADSLLGVPGIISAYKRGRVALVNAPGTGVADDKVIYAFAPQIIKYYLGEDAIIPNVPTYVCSDPKQLQHVLANLDKLVVKAANASGGYGMLIGPHSTAALREDFALKLKADPRNYIAQPTLALSRVPTIVNDHFEGRHVDLRPYILFGKDVYVLPGGLTRVALRRGSLVVNSSQGGGSKDTWVAGRPTSGSWNQQNQTQHQSQNNGQFQSQ